MTGEIDVATISGSGLTEVIGSTNPNYLVVFFVNVKHLLAPCKECGLREIVILEKNRTFFVFKNTKRPQTNLIVDTPVLVCIVANYLTGPIDAFVHHRAHLTDKIALIFITTLVAKDIELGGFNFSKPFDDSPSGVNPFEQQKNNRGFNHFESP